MGAVTRSCVTAVMTLSEIVFGALVVSWPPWRSGVVFACPGKGEWSAVGLPWRLSLAGLQRAADETAPPLTLIVIGAEVIGVLPFKARWPAVAVGQPK